MVILEFTNDRIKLLQALKKGRRIVLSNLSKITVGGLSDEAISGAILDLMNDAGIKTVNSIVSCIPRHLVTVRNLRIPSLDDAELKNMVKLQAGKQLPYSLDELIWDFKVIEKRPDGYSDILLAMVHRNGIDRFVKILTDCKLTAETIILSSEALLGWYLAVYGPGHEDASSSNVSAVIDIDTSYIDVAIIYGGTLEFSRSFPFEDDLQELSEEIRKTFSSYEAENRGRKVSSIILTGIEQRAARLKPFIETVCKTGKIDVVHPLRVLSEDYRETAAGYLDLAKDTSFSSLLGIAYNSKDITMSFLPPEEKTRAAKSKKTRMLIKTILLISAVILAFLGIFAKTATDTKSQLNSINSKIGEAEPQVKRLKEISENIEIIKQHLDMKGSSIDIIREVYKIAPPEVSISVLDFELEKALTLRGISTDLSSVFKFASDLEKSPYFKDCQIKYAQKRIVKTQELVDFELNCRLGKVIK